MGIFDRVKSTASSAKDSAKRQTKKARLQMAGARLERRIRTKKTDIGVAVYPKIRSGELEVSNADVTVAMTAIAALEDELKANQAALAALETGDDEEAESGSEDGEE